MFKRIDLHKIFLIFGVFRKIFVEIFLSNSDVMHRNKKKSF